MMKTNTQQEKSGKKHKYLIILIMSSLIVFLLGLLFLLFQLNKNDDEISLNDKNEITTELPVITLKGDAAITVIQGNDYEEPGYDVSDGDLFDKVVIEGSVDVNCEGTYEINYRVTNNNGDTALAIRTVTVITRSPHAQVPIFMYHEVADETWGIEGLFVKVSDFEAQMKYLSDNGYQTLFMNEIKNQSDFNKKVILTFDDAYSGFYTNALPILKKYNIKANLYVISSCFGDPYVTVEQLKEINNSGLVQIGSHSKNHPDLTAISQDELEAELRESKEELENILGIKVTTFVYPLGKWNSDVIDMTKLHYADALVIEGTVAKINSDTNYHRLPRYRMQRNTTLQSFIKMCSYGK